MNLPLPVAALPPVMSDAVFALTLVLLLVSPMAIAGLALINAGLGRSRSAAQALLGNLAIVAVTVPLFDAAGSLFTSSFFTSAATFNFPAPVIALHPSDSDSTRTRVASFTSATS